MTAQEIIRELGDIEGKFNIDREQAERIAERADSVDEFLDIWENEDWWVDG